TNLVVRRELAAGLRELDDVFAERFRIAKRKKELPADTDPAVLGKLASAVLHTLALRARAGEPRSVLEPAALAMVDILCGDLSRPRPLAPDRRAATGSPREARRPGPGRRRSKAGRPRAGASPPRRRGSQ